MSCSHSSGRVRGDPPPSAASGVKGQAREATTPTGLPCPLPRGSRPPKDTPLLTLRKRRGLVLIACLSVAIAGCGSKSTKQLSNDLDQQTRDTDAAEAVSTVTTYCADPAIGDKAAAARAVDRLVALYRKDPSQAGEVKDAASSLDNACDPVLARRLDRELQ